MSETSTPAAPAQAAQVAKTPSPKKTFQDLVNGDAFKAQIMMALPKHLTPERFLRVLQTAIIKQPKLLECTQESMFKSIFDCAAAGLELDGRRAALVPLRNRKKPGQPLEANYWVMYQGLAELVMRSGVASSIHADTVHDNDKFEYDRGLLTTHKIDFAKDRGKPYAAYCIIRMKDGGEKVEVMGREEIERIRRASPGADADAWTNHPGEMWKKTAFKRAAKWVPLSAEIKNVIEAEHEDDEPTNVTPQPSLASLIGSPAAELGAGGHIEHPAANTPPAEEKPVDTKSYTPEQRAAHLGNLQSAMLDAGVSESKVLIYAHANKLAGEGHDELGALPTASLEALLAVVPTLAAPKAK